MKDSQQRQQQKIEGRYKEMKTDLFKDNTGESVSNKMKSYYAMLDRLMGDELPLPPRYAGRIKGISEEWLHLIESVVRITYASEVVEDRKYRSRNNALELLFSEKVLGVIRAADNAETKLDEAYEKGMDKDTIEVRYENLIQLRSNAYEKTRGVLIL